jgi:hypothetical protein
MNLNRYIFLVLLFLFVPLYILMNQRVSSEIKLPDPSDWVDYGAILHAGVEGKWDHILWGGFANSVIKKDGKVYLYYQGSESYQGAPDDTVMWRSIGVAVSEDGINFKKYPGNPILTWFPNKNGEEGAVSSGVTLGNSNDIVLFYGANTEESATTVNADARVAVSQDGLNFVDRGIVLDRTNSKVWGFGDEIFPVGAIHDNGRWIVYYIPNGVPQSGKLGVAYGDQMDHLPITSQVKSGIREIPIWGTTGHAKVGEETYALFLTNLRAGTLEVRTMMPDKPSILSHPIETYPLKTGQQATIWLDKERNTWFMYYQDDEWYGVKLAPAGAPDNTPPSTPAKLTGIYIDEGLIDLNWQPADDPDTGVILYLVYRNGEQIGTTKGSFFSAINNYETITARYQVSAVNYHGLEGPKSTPAMFKTRCSP